MQGERGFIKVSKIMKHADVDEEMSFCGSKISTKDEDKRLRVQQLNLVGDRYQELNGLLLPAGRSNTTLISRAMIQSFNC